MSSGPYTIEQEGVAWVALDLNRVPVAKFRDQGDAAAFAEAWSSAPARKRDLNEVRRLAYEAGSKVRDEAQEKAFLRGQRAMRQAATDALAAAGHADSAVGVIGALPIEGDMPVPS